MTRRSWIAMGLLLLVVPAQALAQLRATLFASGFTRPVGFVPHPTDPSVVFVLEKDGRIRTVINGVVGGDFLNLVGQVNPAGEQGLLGMAFAPDFSTSSRVYVSFNNGSSDSVIARFKLSTGNPLQLDAATRFDLVWPDGAGGTRSSIDQPDAFANHKGGNIAFGPDGHLYFGLGDGGSGNDPFHFAQDPGSLLGKMLRIDVSVNDSDPRGYRVPVDNPYVGVSGTLPEIWSFGLRNPWRWSFDYPGPQSTGALLIADVGQNAWEEVNYEPAQAKGRNYGWRNREGTFEHVVTEAPAFLPLKDPILQYPHPLGSSITGGFVYRGTALGPFYVGRYFFGDFVTGRVWSLGVSIDLASGDAWGNSLIDHTTQLSNGSAQLSSFGVDLAGELYLVSYFGAVYKIGLTGAAPAAGCSSPDPWAGLGAGGRCYSGTWFAPVIRGDLTSDGLADLILQDGTPFGGGGTPTNALTLWQMQFASQRSSTSVSLLPSPSDPLNTSGWRAVSIDDFSGDGRPDILVQHVNGALRVRVMHGHRQIATESISESSNTWTVVGTGDINLDGSPDLIWQNFTSGALYTWLLRPVRGKPTIIGQGFLLDELAAPLVVSNLAWRVVGAGDFSGDGRTDLVLQNESTGGVQLYYLNWGQRTATVPTVPGSAALIWRIRAVADFNGDQRPDFVWQQATAGSAPIFIWYMHGPNLIAGSFTSPSASTNIGIAGGR